MYLSYFIYLFFLYLFIYVSMGLSMFVCIVICTTRVLISLFFSLIKFIFDSLVIFFYDLSWCS